jgi:mRNA interferase HigB
MLGLLEFFTIIAQSSHNGNIYLDIYLGTIYIIDVRIISRKTIVDFYNRQKETRDQLETWYHEVKKAEWNKPQDVKALYGSASIIGKNRVVFNIKGNKYRLITEINYQMKIVYIRFIGTHKEYDKINAEEI